MRKKKEGDLSAGGNLPATKTRFRPIKNGLWVDFKAVRIDGRTALGKTVNLMRRELFRHVGGSPSIVQKILIERIIHKSIKAHLYEVAVLVEGEQGSKPHYLALVNSLRLDLLALGLKGSGQKVLDLTEYLKANSENEHR